MKNVNREGGFITMIVILLMIVAIAIFFAIMRIQSAQQG